MTVNDWLESKPKNLLAVLMCLESAPKLDITHHIAGSQHDEHGHPVDLHAQKAALDDVNSAGVVNAKVTMSTKTPSDILQQMLRDAYLAGAHTAVTQIGKDAVVPEGLSAAEQAMDWSAWTPGWPQAAGQVRDGGLADLLSQADATIGGIQDTAMTRLGNALGDSIDNGWSVDQTADYMSDLIADPARAYVIANTETNRAMSAATQATYLTNNIAQYDWIAEDDACPECLDLEDGSPYDVDGGDEVPPDHPSCRCAMAPVVDLSDDISSIDEGDGGDDEELAQSVLGKEFNPDQPRDEHGRFEGGGNSGKSDYVSHSGSPRVGMGDIKPTAGNIADLKNSTAAPYMNSKGEFTPERQALHDQIVRDTLKGTTSVANPTYTMMGGGPASGKSSMITGGKITTGNTVVIDADKIKGQLPEVQAMQKAGDQSWAAKSHEESSYLAARIQAASFETSRNTLLDGTGDSSAEKLGGKIDAAKAAGYKVSANYATISVDTALGRAASRAERTGRSVPESTIRQIYSNISNVLPQVMGKFDSMKIYDNNGTGLRLIATGQNGGLTVHDPAAYNGFLANDTGGFK